MHEHLLGRGDVLAWLLLLASVAPGWYAWRETRLLGDKLTRWNRLVQRVALVGLVFLGVLGTVACLLWKLGAPLPIGAEATGRISTMAWLPPSMIAWAAWTYAVLRLNTRKGGRHEKPS